MALSSIVSHRLVKSEDLNHHGTFFAGRAAEWIIESGFTAVAIVLPPNNIVCSKVDGLDFFHPVRLGTVLRMKSTISYVGRSSIMVNVEVASAKDTGNLLCEAFLLFVHVDENTRSSPHGLTLEPETDAEYLLVERAQQYYQMSIKRK